MIRPRMHNLSRRRLLQGFAALGSAAAGAPLLAACRSGASKPAERSTNPKRVVYTYLYHTGPSRPFERAFREQMRALGWEEGRTVTIDTIDGDGHPDHLAQVAGDLVRSGAVDVFVAACTPDARVLLQVTTTVPIVVAAMGDAVKAGIVQSLARPGANVTGLSALLLPLSAKRIEILKEVFPSVSRAVVIWNPARPDNVPELEVMTAAAQALGVDLQALSVQQPSDVDAALAVATNNGAEALLNLGDNLVSSAADRVTAYAARQRLPALYENREYVDVGGLMSYGPNFDDLHRRAAVYTDKILKGARPAELPVEQPTTFELVVNLKTAQSLGFAIPPSVLARASEVIK